MKRFFENLSIKSKLGIGFYTILAIFILFALFQFLTLNRLAESQDTGASRSDDAAMLNEMGSIGYKLYMGASNIIMSKGAQGSDADWIRFKKEADSNLQILDKIVISDEDRAAKKEIDSKYAKLVDIMENQIIPLIHSKTIAPDSLKKDTVIKDKSAQIYKLAEIVDEECMSIADVMTIIEHNIEDEMHKTDENFDNNVKVSRTSMIFFVLIASIFVLIVIYFFTNIIVPPVKKMTTVLNTLATGELKKEDLDLTRKDEIGEMSVATNKLTDGLFATATFASEIGKGNLNVEFTPLSEKDTLGNALLEMQSSLIKADEEERLRKAEDDRRNWATAGYAKFGEILRKNNDDMEELSFDIIKNLVNYTNMNQGGLFIYNDNDTHHPFLEMTACFAYDRQKYVQKSIEIGEGMVGACFQEGQTIYITQVPNNYIEITSGLGEANPSCILIVPLKLNDKIYGIIEMAAFKPLEKHVIEFVEKIGESIASTISSVKVNVRTAQLLEVSQQQAEEMRAQEEEMRQNMEEMHATQEETARREQMLKDEYEAKLQKLQNQINELQNNSRF